MKIFKGFNKDGQPCPVCKTHNDGPCALVQIDGTEDGNIAEAAAVHLDCINLRLTKYGEKTMLYQCLR